MCSCKQSPLQKVEMRLSIKGWNKLANSELKLIDQFIFTKLGLSPSTQEDRVELYGRAKSGG
jgi:hypothetical protein